MQRDTFQRTYKAAVWASALWFAASIVLVGDFIVEGGLPWLAALLMLVPASLMLPLIFARCEACRRTLAWISTHKNFNDQPDPRTLDLCPNCGEQFFNQTNHES